jgi:hypothetical protein
LANDDAIRKAAMEKYFNLSTYQYAPQLEWRRREELDVEE